LPSIRAVHLEDEGPVRRPSRVVEGNRLSGEAGARGGLDLETASIDADRADGVASTAVGLISTVKNDALAVGSRGRLGVVGIGRTRGQEQLVAPGRPGFAGHEQIASVRP